MHLTIKSPKMIFAIEVSDDATVLCLKQAIQQAHPDIAAGSLRLIYAGKVLVDDRPLQFYSMQSGHAVRMVIWRAAPPAAARVPTVRESLAGVNLGRTGHPVTSVFGPYFFQNPEAFAAIIDAVPLLAHDPEIREFRRNADARRAALQELEALAGGAVQWTNPFGMPDAGPVDIVAYLNSALGREIMRHITEHPDMWRDAYMNSPVVDGNPAVRLLVSRPHLVQDGVRRAEELLGDPEQLRQLFHAAQEMFVPPQAGDAGLERGRPVPNRGVSHNVGAGDLGPVQLVDDEGEGGEEFGDGGLHEAVDLTVGDIVAPHIVVDVNAPPDQRFAVQLRLMEGMGFMDQHRNTQVLIATNGDLENAVEWLLMRQ
jgi:hypothetical protein